MNSLSLFLLGSVLVERDGDRLSFPRRKSVALLAYLAMQGGTHRRDTLATLFWPELDQARARAGLRRALASLKKSLGGDWLAIDRQQVGVDSQAEIWLDVAEFRSLLGECKTHGHAEEEVCADCLPLMVRAVDLYRDDFLAGFTLRDSPGFDDWQFFETEGLRDGLSSALERLARAHGAQGECEPAIVCGRRWLALDPLHEPAHVLLMELQSRAGQRAAALRQYDECVEILKEEFGAPPQDETTLLYEAIKAGADTAQEAASLRPAPSLVEWRRARRVVNAPPQAIADLFRDRVGERAALANHIGGEAARLVTVVGRAGMGKTALACKVMDDLERNRHPESPPIEGVVYLTAGELSLDRLVHDVGDMVGDPARSKIAAGWAEAGGELAAKVDAVLAALEEEVRYVVLLDNLEDLLEASGRLVDADLRCFVDRALQSQSGVRVVVTSRERLYVPPEGQRRAARIVLGEGLPLGEASQMLRDLDPDGELGLLDAEREKLEQAADLARRVPRALELLAFVLRQSEGTLSLDELLGHEELFLEDMLVVDRLAAEVYERLSEGERRVVEALAVLEDAVPSKAVEYLLAPWYPDLDVRLVLRRLIRGHFVSYNRMTRRYALHPVDRTFALRVMPETKGADEQAFTRRGLELRAAAYYRGRRKPEAEWLSIDDLKPQLRELEHLMRAGSADEACQVLNSIDADHLRRWGHARLIVQLREQLFDDLQSPALRGLNDLRLGQALVQLGRNDHAAQHLEAALSAATDIGDLLVEAQSVGELGTIQCRTGDLNAAITFHEKAFQICEKLGEVRGQGEWLRWLGNDYLYLEQMDAALDYYRKALIACQAAGARYEEGMNWNNLAVVLREMGHMTEAIEHCERALAIFREVGFRRGEAMCLNNLASAHNELGDVAKSLELHLEGLEISRQIADRLGEAYHALNIGSSHFNLRDFARASISCRRAADLYSELDYELGLLDARSMEGWTQLGLEQLAEARRAFHDAVAIDHPRGCISALPGLGVACLHMGDNVGARDAFSRAVDGCETMLTEAPDRYMVLMALGLSMAGMALLDDRSLDEVIRSYRHALTLSTVGALRDARFRLGQLEAATGADLSDVLAVLDS